MLHKGIREREGNKDILLYSNTNIFITKKEEILMTVIVLISAIGHKVVASIYQPSSSNINSVFPLSSASTSADHHPLPGRVIKTFIPEGSGPLTLLPRLGHCTFPLNLITGHSNTKSHLKGSPLCSSSPVSHCDLDHSPASTGTPFFAC